MSKRIWLKVIAILMLFSMLTPHVHAATPRFQKEFVADGYSWVHSAGGVVIYSVARKEFDQTVYHSFLWSIGAATLWEIGDAFKPNRAIYGDWRDEFVTADGFSYSDIVYHMAGTYCAWLVMESTDDGLLLSVAPSHVRITWRF